ncbi:retrotransposon protein, putative, ty1-copia subclass [Tanacetum coccineum]|uniref:Retrotransposon protein, putative, ty1-copia subclass n=1 Tax=Tanacetum coccineum TaxID=301880 RepID=A0ABQ5HKH6_9ASTR
MKSSASPIRTNNKESSNGKSGNPGAYDMLKELKTLFVQNYNIRSMGKTVNELHAMLKLHEKTLTKRDAPALHAIRAGKVSASAQHAVIHAIGSRNYPNIYPEFAKEQELSPKRARVLQHKRAKFNLDSSLLWHCRLGHISKKRIEKLQHDGLLNSIDSKPFEKCIPCLSGKMARKPYSHQVERAKDLLGLIHTDEVENQLGKTIKSLRSDRGGEYMSQEFLDHLKEYGIIAHRTPPYTPQHNRVSERRNRTILDLVRSMMSQTTLPKSFWDYALESATRILNMVPTKKFEKTPYEV